MEDKISRLICFTSFDINLLIYRSICVPVRWLKVVKGRGRPKIMWKKLSQSPKNSSESMQNQEQHTMRENDMYTVYLIYQLIGNRTYSIVTLTLDLVFVRSPFILNTKYLVLDLDMPESSRWINIENSYMIQPNLNYCIIWGIVHSLIWIWQMV